MFRVAVRSLCKGPSSQHKTFWTGATSTLSREENIMNVFDRNAKLIQRERTAQVHEFFKYCNDSVFA